jgi:hypothetical protein
LRYVVHHVVDVELEIRLLVVWAHCFHIRTSIGAHCNGLVGKCVGGDSVKVLGESWVVYTAAKPKARSSLKCLELQSNSHAHLRERQRTAHPAQSSTSVAFSLRPGYSSAAWSTRSTPGASDSCV